MLVAGFQGVSTARDVTTLGRGGSDTTAVALAAAVGAEVCEIYTDVAGRLQRRPADRPRRPQAAGRLVRRDARDGGLGRRRAAAAQRRVRAQPRRAHPLPIELRRRAPVPLSCRSRRPWNTRSSPPSRTRPARPASRSRRARHARRRRPGDHRARRGERQHRHDHPERAASREGARADMSFTVPRDDLRTARDTLEPLAARARHGDRQRRADGQGLDRRRRHAKRTPASRRRCSRRSATKDINIEMISTSPIRISCVVRGDRVADAVRALHSAFELGRRGHDPRRAAVRDGWARSAPTCGSPSSAPPAPSARSCCAARARALPGRRARRRSPPSARPGASSTTASSASRCTTTTIEGFDLALFSAGGVDVARVGAALRRRAARVVIDNSSAWRMDARRAARRGRGQPGGARRLTEGIIANPNCSTMQMVVALKPLHDARRHRARSSSRPTRPPRGAGQKGVDELLAQVARGRCDGSRRPTAAASTPHQIAFNVAAAASSRFARRRRLHRRGDEDENETRKILGDAEHRASTPTCVRVPVVVGHSRVGATSQTREPLERRARRRAARGRSRRRGRRRPARRRYPLPLERRAATRSFVGRVRRDLAARARPQPLSSSATTCSRAPR